MSYLKELTKEKKSDLVNQLFNERVSDMADYSPGQDDAHGHGKRIPYIGWFWRNVDFVNNSVSIGDCGDFIGVMKNNKWDYPERQMTKGEVKVFIGFLEYAMAEYSKGGNLAEMAAKRDAILSDMWDWFQTLKIEGDEK